MTEVKIGRQTLEVRQTIVDRVVGYLSPRAGLERLRARTMMALAGGYEGGKRTRRGTRYWRPAEGSANADTLPDLPHLRARTRDLERNTPIATGAISMQVNSVVGDGLVLQPSIDREILGLTAKQAEAWERQAVREFSLFCKSADFTRVQQLQEMQCLAFAGVLQSGDVFALRRFRKDPGDVYGTKLQLVEADRVSNANRSADTDRLVAGVEIDQDGVPQVYHVADRHPFELRGRAANWSKVPARDSDGRRLVIHLYDRSRPDQTRGVPYLAPVIEEIKKLGDYTDSEVTAALVSSMFTVFVTSGTAADADGSSGPALLGEKATGDGLADDELKLESGAVITLSDGEKIEVANPGRPNERFDPFVQAVLRQIGVALDLPFELLIRHFTASYSASRAALEIAWQFFRRRRAWMARNFCDVVYDWFVEEAVSTGRLDAPGFFRDPALRAAWLGADWVGPVRPSLDPTKDSNADKQDVEEGFKSIAQVITERTGGSFERKHDQRVKEVRARVGAGLQTDPGAAAARPTPPSAEPPRRDDPDEEASDIEPDEQTDEETTDREEEP